MKKPEYISIDKFNYLLPEERIAKYPLKERDHSKLLKYEGCKISEKKFGDIPSILKAEDQLYFNTTRVVQARLKFRKKTGAQIEIFCLEPHLPSDYQVAFSSTEPVEFICLLGNAKKWKDDVLEMELQGMKLTATKAGRSDDKFIIRFLWDKKDVSFGEILELCGSTPIPPYLNRAAEKSDASTYQTVYADRNGSVAAPTAGLHFTEKVLKEIRLKGVLTNELTLHVGAGTFIPVKDENAVDHTMHAELVSVDLPLLASLEKDASRRIAVGTTSTRSLESIYWLGVRALGDETFSFENLFLEQWEAYGLDDTLGLKDAIAGLRTKMQEAGISEFTFHTRIMITPGYQFKVIDGLFTNFHQPKSTLLLLISAIVGDDWQRIYDFALENNFRFLSYGDSSLLFL